MENIESGNLVPRYVIRPGGTFRYRPSDYMPTHVWRVVDRWLESEVREFRAQGNEAAKLMAETLCSELNAPALALDMLCGLAIHLDNARNKMEANPGDLLEDVDKILEHMIGQLRGMVTEPLDQAHLFYQAPNL